MTIDEAIAHALEVAEQNESSAITYKNCKEIKANMYEKLTAEKAENDCRECAADHRQLAEWLTELKELKALVAGYNPADIQTLEMLFAMMRNQNNNDTNLCELCDKEVELKEAKRLLKAAVEDMNSNNICFNINACNVCAEKNCISCDTFHWRYTDEVLKLIES